MPKIQRKRDKRSCLVGGKPGYVFHSPNGAGGWPPKAPAGRGPMYPR
jgi:hypothetical protein